MDIKAKMCLALAKIMKSYNFKRFAISFKVEDDGVAIYNNETLIGYSNDIRQANLYAMVMCMSEYDWVQKLLSE